MKFRMGEYAAKKIFQRRAGKENAKTCLLSVIQGSTRGRRKMFGRDM